MVISKIHSNLASNTFLFKENSFSIHLPFRTTGNNFVFTLKYDYWNIYPSIQVSGGQNNSDLHLHLASQLSVHFTGCQ